MNLKTQKLRFLFELFKSTLPVLIFIVVYALSYCAYCHHYHLNNMTANSAEVLYKSLRLFVVEGEIDEPQISSYLNIMRFVAPLTTVMAAIAAFMTLLGRRFKDLRLTMLKDHVVICGLGRKGNTLARQFLKQGRKVVVIDIDETNDYLPIQMLSNIWTIAGNATDPEILVKANLPSAFCLVIATGSDSTNINILIHAAGLIKNRHRKEPLNVILHMYDPDICPLMRNKQVLKSIRDSVSLVTVNMYELAARELFIKDMIKNMPTAIGDKRRMHIVIAGFGHMGKAIALQAAKIGHFPNATEKNSVKTLITIIDADAAGAYKSFHDQYPQFGKICQVKIIEGDILAPDVQDKLVATLKDSNNLSSIFICYENDYYNLKKALGFIPFLHRQEIRRDESDIDIFVELSESEGLCHLLDEEISDTAWAKQLKGFMAVPDIFHIDEVSNSPYEIMARVFAAFYENRFGVPISIEKPGWNNLSFRLQDSNLQAAHHVAIKLNALDYELVPSVEGKLLSENKDSIFLPNETIQLPITDDQKEILAKMEHNRWIAEIQLEGYSSGPKNHELRTHPCCVPWDELEEKDRKKDLAQIDIIPVALLNANYIPMKKQLAEFYRQSDPGNRLIFEDLAIGLLKGGANIVGQSRKCDLGNSLSKTQSNDVLIVAGSLSDTPLSQQVLNLLSSVLSEFSGIVISSGIRAGISGQLGLITESLAKQNLKKYMLLGYLPRTIPAETRDSRYDLLVETDRSDFSELEPIQYWLDIVLAGMKPQKVKFLRFGSDDDSIFDLQLAQAVGANIEILE